MTPDARRFLIVNADDLGLSAGVNRGIARAHDEGIVTSASLMVRQPGAAHAADYAKQRPGLSVGLHLDLGEWVYRDGQWLARYEVVPPGDAAAVSAEVGQQLETFLRLVGRPPTHIDSHQHAHRGEPLRSVARALATELGVPLRHDTPGVQYCGAFFGQSREGAPTPQAITPDALSRIIRSLPPGVTELACHPGDDPALESVYLRERLVEVAALCDPAPRAALAENGVRLISFAQVSECRR